MADGAAGVAAGGVAPAWVGTVLNAEGRWALRRKLPYLLGIMMLFDSWDSIVIAFALPAIAAEWNLGALQSGWLISAGYAGQLVGALVCGAIAETRGRLPVLRILIIVMSLLAIACGLAGDFGQLLAFRFVQGITIGGALPVSICYINEIAPAATRGRFFGTFQFLMLSGYGLASLVSAVVIPQWGWRPMFLMGALPLLFVPLLYRLPESPRWLAAQGRGDAARRALQRLGGDVPQELPEAEAAPAVAAPARRVPVTDLFAPGLRGRTTTAVLLWFLTSLVSFGLVTWVPSIYVSNFGIPIAEALRYTAIASVCIFGMPLLLRFTIDKIGRRPLPLAGTAIGGISLLVLTRIDPSAYQWLVVCTIIGQIGVSFSSMVLWPWTAEIYETRVRAVALGAASSLARAASMLTPLVVGGLLALTGSILPVFMVFGFASISAALLWWLAAPETAGRQLDG